MDPSLLLLGLVRAVAPVKGDGAHLSLFVRVGRAIAGLAEVVPPATLGALEALLSASAAGSLTVSAATAQIRLLAGALRQVAADDPGRGAALAALAAQTQTIIALRCGGNGGPGVLRHGTITLAASPLADLIDEWRLAVTPETPETIVAYVPAEAVEPVAVRLRGQSFIERRVVVSYHANLVSPRLLLTAPSRSVRDELPQDHDAWSQLPIPDYDLAVLTEQERHKGTVVTRRLEGRVIARGATLSLYLDAPKDHAIISTEILDETGRPLARVLRWPPVAG